MEELLKNISLEDLEKIKMLFSIIPGQERKEVVTIRVFRDEYLNLIQDNRSKSYYKSVKLAFNYLIDFFSIQHSIHSLQQKDIENFLIHLQQKVKPVSHSGSRGGNGYVVYFRNLKAAFNKAKDWGYVKENYFTKVKLPKRQKTAPAFVNGDQLLAISSKIKNEVVKDVVVVAFHTGMRLDEIVNLRWKNVDLPNRIITVGDENFVTKGRKQRFIPIDEEVYIVLTNRNRIPSLNPLCPLDISLPNQVRDKLLKKGGEYLSAYVFCKKNEKKFTGDYFSRRFKSACRAAGLENSLHFHSLRHSFASNLAQRGVPIYTIKELLGHSSITTTEIYSHLNMDTLREAIKKLDNRPHPDPLLSREREISPLQIFRINSMEQ